MTSPSPSPTTVPVRRYQNPSKKTVNPSFSDLPSSILEMIMSRLVLKDNIRASAACKTWREAALYVRVVEKHPWLLCFPKPGSSLIKLHDPLQCKSYTLDLPELSKSTVCYSRDGWLLMHRSSSNDLFFFNPFTRELISLPKLDMAFLEIAFSCPPTSDRCLVLALDLMALDISRRLISSTCRPGEAEWITEEIPGVGPFNVHSKLVYLNGRFYCFNAGPSCLYSFDVSSRKWCKWCIYDAKYICGRQQWKWEEELVFLAEKDGELFLMLTCRNEKPKVYKLVSLFQWEKISDSDDSNALDGWTIFVSLYNVELRSDLPWMRNSVYFSRFGKNRKSCVSYSFDENRFSTRKEWQNWRELCPPHSLWIDPPSKNNVLDYL